jgi:hypothetical protein
MVNIILLTLVADGSKMKKIEKRLIGMTKWTLYTLTLGFAVYWVSNLILWFPWSYSAALGMTLMLTVSPLLWGYAVFLSLKAFPGRLLMKGALQVALIFVTMAVVMDYVFFGLIRNAMEQLYHPATFYGYGFVAVFPFIVVFLFGNKIEQMKKPVGARDFIRAGLSGLICFGALVLIILLDIAI